MTLNIFRENKLSFVSNLALWFTFIIEFELSSGKGVLWDKLRQLMEKETGSWVVNMRFLSPPFLIDTCWWNSKRLSRVIRTKKISFIELVNCWIVMFIDSSWSVQSLKKNTSMDAAWIVNRVIRQHVELVGITSRRPWRGSTSSMTIRRIAM